jgi:NodT family efflux transporter outer membrane factor (OMF) lipoprotein
MLPPFRAAAFVSSFCGAIVGCSLGPLYHRPDIPPPAQWRDAPGVATPGVATPGVDTPGVDTSGVATPGDAQASRWPEAGWWRGFGSRQLDELIAEAERNNDDLAGAVARVREADAQVRIAGAPLFPTLDVAADATRERTVVPGSATRLGNVFTPQVTASYELDFWGKNRALRDAARATAGASRFDRQTVELTVVRSVAGTYFQALEFLDRIEVARRNLENGRKILRGLTLEQSVGTATGLDVAQQETAVALLDAALPPLLQQYRQSVNALAVLVGRMPESLEVTSGSLAEISSPPIAAGLPSQLLSRRPDVAEAEQQLVAANADLAAARAALFPSISLTAAGGFESSGLASLISPAHRIYAVGAGLTQPIFHGGALHGQVSYSAARYAELLSTYHKTVLTAFGNVDSALIAAQQTAAQQERQRDAVAKARRAFEFAQAQLSAGTVNILTVLNTENALFSAEDVLVQTENSHLQALIDLYTALGGGWQQG